MITSVKRILIRWGRVAVAKVSGRLYVLAAGLFVISVVIQILFAGMGIFSDSTYLYNHIVFVRFMEIFPILMLILSFMGRLPKLFRWMSVLLFLMIYAQYMTANIPEVGAVHPVIAAILFSVAVTTALRAARVVFPGKEGRILKAGGADSQ